MKFKLTESLDEKEFLEFHDGRLVYWQSSTHGSTGKTIAQNPLEIVALLHLGIIEKSDDL